VLSRSINEWINNFITVQAQDAVTVILPGRIDKVMAGLRTKLETAYKASGGKKVTIISHSMGGLLVRCFMSINHDVSFYICYVILLKA
jgi:triacylglycerol esterase/lipase EstA (alpha/beta hydrolase family)